MVGVDIKIYVFQFQLFLPILFVEFYSYPLNITSLHTYQTV